MNKAFVRKTGDQPRRLFRFLGPLARAIADYLPEAGPMFPGMPVRDSKSKTIRLRPEVANVIETLIDRYAANQGIRLTHAEVITMALAEAVPRLTARDFHR